MRVVKWHDHTYNCTFFNSYAGFTKEKDNFDYNATLKNASKNPKKIYNKAGVYRYYGLSCNFNYDYKDRFFIQHFKKTNMSLSKQLLNNAISISNFIKYYFDF